MPEDKDAAASVFKRSAVQLELGPGPGRRIVQMEQDAAIGAVQEVVHDSATQTFYI